MALESVEDLALYLIFCELGPEDTAKVACVSNRLRHSASDDSLWRKFCYNELNLSSPVCPLGKPTSSFKEAYQVWRKAFSMYPWPLVLRVKRYWDQLNNWLTKNYPEIEETLQKGASEAELEELEKSLKVKLPLPTRILYRFHNGQNVIDEYYYHVPNLLLGLIGGYSFYDHLVNVFLLPLDEIVSETKDVIRSLGFSSRSKYVVVASSGTFTEKIFFLNCETGQLYVGTRNLKAEGEMMPCVPSSLISSVHDPHGAQQQDGLLLWLEEHGRRLQNGIIKVREEENIKSINLFPEEAPSCYTAVTNGVQIRASAVFIPELSDVQDESNSYYFSYSIRMSLLQGEAIIKGMPFCSCQLYWRHWYIRANDREVSDVDGEAVIGQYPLLLLPDGKEFVYQSCTPLPSTQGSVEGFFQFVLNSLREPKGEFEVKVPQFPLELPDYIF